MKPSSLSASDKDITTLFDDIVACLDALLVEAQISPNSSITHFSEVVEEAMSTMAHVLKSSLFSAVDNVLINKVDKAIAIL